MAKRHEGDTINGQGAERTARGVPARPARAALERLEIASYLAARTRPLVVAAARIRSAWSIMRPLERGDGAARRLRETSGAAMRLVGAESHAKERLRPALSLSRAVESGRDTLGRAQRSPRAENARAGAAKDARAHDARQEHRREERGERSARESEPRHARRNPAAEMHYAVMRALETQWAVVRASRSALGLTHAVHGALERTWHDAFHPYGRRPEHGDAALGSTRRFKDPYRDATEHRLAREPRAASDGGERMHMHHALARFGHTVGLLAQGLRGQSAAERGPHAQNARGHGLGEPGRTAPASIRVPPAPTLIAAPALSGGAQRQPAKGTAAGAVVINSSPTVVVNRGDSPLDLEHRMLEVLRRHRDALYEQWQRERDKRLRTEF